MNCPICHTPIDDTKATTCCPNCQWELVFLPSTASQELLSLFDRKAENHRTGYTLLEETKRLQIENDCLRKQIDSLKKTKTIVEKEAELQAAKVRLKSCEEARSQIEEYKKRMETLLNVYKQACCLGYGDKPIVIEIRDFLTNRGVLS